MLSALRGYEPGRQRGSELSSRRLGSCWSSSQVSFKKSETGNSQEHQTHGSNGRLGFRVAGDLACIEEERLIAFRAVPDVAELGTVRASSRRRNLDTDVAEGAGNAKHGLVSVRELKLSC